MNEASHKLLELAKTVRAESSKILAQAAGTPEYPKLLESLAASVEFLETGAGQKAGADRLSALVALANVLDESRDTVLMKYAAVLDGVIEEEALKKKEAQYTRYNFPEGFDKLKQRLEKEKVQKPDTWEAIDKIRETDRTDKRESNYGGAYKKRKDEACRPAEVHRQYKEQVAHYRPLQMPLSTRTCPDHPGAQMMRVADNTYQCSLDHRIYPWNEGFVTYKGNVVPGGDVANQIKDWNAGVGHYLFQTRESQMTRGASDIGAPFTKGAMPQAVTKADARQALKDLEHLPLVKDHKAYSVLESYLDDPQKPILSVSNAEDGEEEKDSYSKKLETEELSMHAIPDQFPHTKAVEIISKTKNWAIPLKTLLDDLGENYKADGETIADYDPSVIDTQLNANREANDKPPFFSIGPNVDGMCPDASSDTQCVHLTHTGLEALGGVTLAEDWE